MAILQVHLSGVDIKQIEINNGLTYRAGYLPDCQILLDRVSQIAPHHFKIYSENNRWIVVIEDNAPPLFFENRALRKLKLSSGTTFEIPPYTFKFQNLEQDAHQNLGLNIDTNEQTSPGIIQHDNWIPYLRIQNSATGETDQLRLEGSLWLAGRDEICEIQLNDPRISRRQFEISRTGHAFNIFDLGSANGTILNDQRVPADTPVPIQSGDIISIGNLKITFEIRDKEFKDKFKRASSALPALNFTDVADAGNHPTSFNRSDNNSQPSAYRKTGMKLSSKKGRKGQQANQNNLQMMGATLVFIAIMYFIFSDSSGNKSQTLSSINPPQNAAGTGDPKNLAFSRLPMSKQKFVKDTYTLAQNLALQSKWELASAELAKIHQLLPEGYEESLQLSQTFFEREKDKLEALAIAKERENLERSRRRLEEIILLCQKYAEDESTSPEQVQSCLSEAYTIDPEDARLNQLVSIAQQRVEKKMQHEEDRKAYQALVAQRQHQFERAQRLQAQQKPLEAIQAYEIFLKSRLPDPQNLKIQATALLEKLKNDIKKESEGYINVALEKAANNDHRGALELLEKAQALDPKNIQISSLSERLIRELNTELHSIYSDSIIEESLGNVDQAQVRWKKITEIDRIGGEYFRKAKNKLLQYRLNVPDPSASAARSTAGEKK